MVDRYWRKFESVENDIENSIQISSILLKLREYDEKLSDLSKIGNNENSISSNLGKIDTNKNDISPNLGKIDTNKNDISSNLTKIGNNENSVSSNLTKIGNNEYSFSSNLGKIDTNKSDISSNLNQINHFKSILPKLEIFKKTYSIKNQSFKFNRNIFFKLLEIEIENNFNVDGKLEINSNIINMIIYKETIIVYSMNIRYLMIKMIYFIRQI